MTCLLIVGDTVAFDGRLVAWEEVEKYVRNMTRKGRDLLPAARLRVLATVDGQTYRELSLDKLLLHLASGASVPGSPAPSFKTIGV